MPTIRVPGGFRNFNVFWCDANAAGAAAQSGLVLLVFDRPLPANCRLVVIGTTDGGTSAICLCLAGFESQNTARAHAAPIPGAWGKFDLAVSCLGGAEEDHVALTFDRVAVADDRPPAVLTITQQNSRLRLAGPNAHPGAVVMRLYQRTNAAGVIGPATRAAGAKRLAYTVATQSPRKPEHPAPSTPQPPKPIDRSFKVFVTAPTREAAAGLEHIQLWHASLARFGPSRSTLGIFQSQKPSGFRQVTPLPVTPNRLSFTVPGATPGDILAVTTGQEESSIALTNRMSGDSPPTKGSFAIFEVERNGDLKMMSLDAFKPSILPMGSNPDPFLKKAEYQLELIRANGSGARVANARLAQIAAGGFANQATLNDLATSMASPAIFAVALALHNDRVDSCPDPAVAAEIAAIIELRGSGFLERLTSASLGLAAERADIRQALLRQANSNDDPWLGSDGLRSVYEALFDHAAASASAGPIEPDDWYGRTPDLWARIAVIMIATDTRRSASGKTARRLIGVGLRPKLSDVTAPDIDALLTFADQYLAGPPTNHALSDALFWAANDLTTTTPGDQSAEDIRSRLNEARDDKIKSNQTPLIALDDLRRWRTTVRADEIEMRLKDIRDLLTTFPTGGLRAIPRFGRDDPAFASGFDEATLRLQLNAIAASGSWEALARQAAASMTWPAPALAALLATIRTIEQPSSPGIDWTRQRHPDAVEDIQNAEVLFQEGLQGSELLKELRIHVAQEQKKRQDELMRQVDGTIDDARQDLIKMNARQYAVLSAITVLSKRLDDVIEDARRTFADAGPVIKHTDAWLQTLQGTARQRAAEDFEDLVKELAILQKGYVNGIETRLKRSRYETRDKFFADIGAIDRDIESANSNLQRAEEIVTQLGELPSIRWS